MRALVPSWQSLSLLELVLGRPFGYAQGERAACPTSLLSARARDAGLRRGVLALAGLVGVVVALLTLAGCATRRTATAPPTSAGTTKGSPTAKAPVEDEYSVNPTPSTKQALTIGIAMTWGHPYWQNMIAGFKAEAKAQEQQRGLKITLVFSNAEEDAAKQISQCESLAAQQVDAAIVVPVQAEASVRAIWLLNDASIPVVLVNRHISDSSGRAKWVCYTGTDTYEGAKVSADLLMEALNDQGEIVELQQVLGSDPQLARTQALKDVLATHPNVTLISQQTFGANEDKAVAIMEDLLKAHPEVNGVYAHGDNAAIYALKACEAAKRPDIKIVGMGGSKDALALIRKGALVGTSYQQPYEEGCSGMRYAIAYLLGERVKRNTPTPVLPVTQRNASQYEGQF